VKWPDVSVKMLWVLQPFYVASFSCTGGLFWSADRNILSRYILEWWAIFIKGFLPTLPSRFSTNIGKLVQNPWQGGDVMPKRWHGQKIRWILSQLGKKMSWMSPPLTSGVVWINDLLMMKEVDATEILA
jgi:hypothetical protein